MKNFTRYFNLSCEFLIIKFTIQESFQQFQAQRRDIYQQLEFSLLSWFLIRLKIYENV